MFGESILNDAVAIVLATSIDDFAREYDRTILSEATTHPAFKAAFHAIGLFVKTFLSSLFLGATVGCVTALITKFTQLRENPLLESSLFVLMSYSTFLLAEALELSGIVAVLFCGICQAHYTFNNLSEESRQRTKQLFELINFIAENFIFTYIGVSMFTFPKHRWNFGFIFTAFIAIAAGRALNVYPLSFLLNLGRQNKIPLNIQHMMFFSGLRGAMAFALAIRNTLTEDRQIMLTTTSLITITSVIFCGGGTSYMLNMLGIPIGVDESETDQIPFQVRRSGSVSTPGDLHSPGGSSIVSTGQQPQRSPYEKAWLVKKWYNFDVRFMKPLLTNSRPTLIDTLPSCCMPVARVLTTTEQLSTEMREPGQMESKYPCRHCGHLTRAGGARHRPYIDDADDEDLCLEHHQQPMARPSSLTNSHGTYNSLGSTNLSNEIEASVVPPTILDPNSLERGQGNGVTIQPSQQTTITEQPSQLTRRQ